MLRQGMGDMEGDTEREKLHEECGVFGVFAPKAYAIAQDV